MHIVSCAATPRRPVAKSRLLFITVISLLTATACLTYAEDVAPPHACPSCEALKSSVDAVKAEKEALAKTEAQARTDLQSTQKLLSVCGEEKKSAEQTAIGADQQLQQCKTQANQVRTQAEQEAKQAEAAKVELAAQRGEVEKLKGQLTTATAGCASSCDAVTSERDALLDSRRALGIKLDEAQAREAQAAKAKKELEAKIETLGKHSEALVAADAAKHSLEEKTKEQVAVIAEYTQKNAALIKEKESVDAELRQATAAQKSSAELLEKTKAAHTSLLNELQQKRQNDFLFSFAQLRKVTRGLWIFVRSTTCHVSSNAWNGIVGKIPEESKLAAAKIWQEKAGVVGQKWRTDLAPRMYSTMDSLSSSQMARTSRSLYDTQIQPQLSMMVAQAKDQAASGLTIILAHVTSYVDIANDNVDKYFVAPLTVGFPEVKPLIPLSPLDRLCLAVFVLHVSYQVLRRLGFFLRVSCCVLKMLLPCYWCCRRRGSTDSEKKGRGKRVKKQYQPAAPPPTKNTVASSTTGNKPNASPAKQSSGPKGTKQGKEGRTGG